MKDDVIKIKRTRSHSFLKDKLELEQKAATPPTISLDVPDRVLKESKEAPRPVPKLRDDGEPPREAAIEAPSSVVAISTPSEDVKRHVFSIELVKGKKFFFFVFCVLSCSMNLTHQRVNSQLFILVKHLEQYTTAHVFNFSSK